MKSWVGPSMEFNEIQWNSMEFGGRCSVEVGANEGFG
jgi:hypothetical protein